MISKCPKCQCVLPIEWTTKCPSCAAGNGEWVNIASVSEVFIQPCAHSGGWRQLCWFIGMWHFLATQYRIWRGQNIKGLFTPNHKTKKWKAASRCYVVCQGQTNSNIPSKDKPAERRLHCLCDCTVLCQPSVWFQPTEPQKEKTLLC